MDIVKLIKQKEHYVPSQKIEEIRKLFLWSELPISDLEKTYKEFADSFEYEIIIIFRGGDTGRPASFSYYVRYIDESILDKVTELEQKLVKLYTEINNLIVSKNPILKFLKSNKRKITLRNTLLNQYNELIQKAKIDLFDFNSDDRIQTIFEYDFFKTPIMKHISNPVLSNKYINDFHENEKEVINRKGNLFTSFFEIDPAYNYITSKRKLAEELGYNLHLRKDNDYRTIQASKKLIMSYSKTIENIVETFSRRGYEDTRYIFMPLLLYLSDMIFFLKSKKTDIERKHELLELQSYIMYHYYDYKQYVAFNKIINIWTSILLQKKYARGDWWLGVRKYDDNENRNFLFQFILLSGDLIFNSSLVEDYYNEARYFMDVKVATEMSDILSKEILPIVDEYLDDITHNE